MRQVLQHLPKSDTVHSQPRVTIRTAISTRIQLVRLQQAAVGASRKSYSAYSLLTQKEQYHNQISPNYRLGIRDGSSITSTRGESGLKSTNLAAGQQRRSRSEHWHTTIWCFRACTAPSRELRGPRWGSLIDQIGEIRRGYVPHACAIKHKWFVNGRSCRD